MDTDQLEILQMFEREGAELLDALESRLLEIEADPSRREPREGFMRAAHSLKGAAGTAGLRRMSELTHSLESVVHGFGTKARVPNAELFDKLFRAVAVMKDTLRAIGDGHDEPLELAGVCDELRELEAETESTAEFPSGVGRNDVPRFVLGEYDEVRIRVARSQHKELYAVEVADVSATSGGALAALRTIRRTSTVVVCQPPESELLDDDSHGRVSFLVATEPSATALRAALDEAGFAAEVTPWERAPAEAPQAAENAQDSQDAPRPNRALRHHIKVDLERIDALVDLIGELVIVESMVASAPEVVGLSNRRVRNDLSQLTKITRHLQDASMRLRMVRVRGLFQLASSSVRDLSRRSGKEIRLELSGDSTEMDRNMIERLTEPLVHLIRNAADHGLESASERIAAGKPNAGTIHLSAFHQGGLLVLEVRDDGRGLDTDAILEKARARGLVGPDEELDESETHELIFATGFSTAASVTEISGRGVGLDVVRRAVESMRGRVSVTSRRGTGTCMRLILPITLAIIDGMMVACGSEQYIVPTSSIIESIQTTPDMLITHGSRRALVKVRGSMVPLVSLGELLSVPGARQTVAGGLVVVVESAGRRVGLLVDEVVCQQQVVIKSVGEGFAHLPLLAGAAILPSGRVGLIVNVDEVVGRHGGGAAARRAAGMEARHYAS